MPGERLRIDKWLWFARLAKTRTIAQKLVLSGKVRVNRDKIDSAAFLVGPGDVLTVALPPGVRVLRVVALALRRGPASEARTLYEDLTPPVPPTSMMRAAPNPSPGRRPDRRDRRAIAEFRAASLSAERFPPDDD